MSKLEPAFAAALSILLLSACGAAPGAAENGAVEAGANATQNAAAPDPLQPGPPDNAAVDPVPPPDAVSHPDGYLPPAPGEPDPKAVSSATETSPPATEDEYMRNKQAGR